MEVSFFFFWRFLKRVKIELSYDPAIPLLGIYLEKTIFLKDACTPVFIAAQQAVQMSIDRETVKE